MNGGEWIVMWCYIDEESRINVKLKFDVFFVLKDLCMYVCFFEVMGFGNKIILFSFIYGD